MSVPVRTEKLDSTVLVMEAAENSRIGTGSRSSHKVDQLVELAHRGGPPWCARQKWWRMPCASRVTVWPRPRHVRLPPTRKTQSEQMFSASPRIADKGVPPAL